MDPNNHIAMNWRHVCDTNIKYLSLRFLLFLFLTSFGGLGRIKHPSFLMVGQMSATDSRRCTRYCHVKLPGFPSSQQWWWRHAHVWSSSQATAEDNCYRDSRWSLAYSVGARKTDLACFMPLEFFLTQGNIIPYWLGNTLLLYVPLAGNRCHLKK